MNVFTTSTTRPDTRRFQQSPAPLPEDGNNAIDSPNTITCVEERAVLDQIRSMVHQEFHPSTPFQQMLADDLVESIWSKQRFAAIANQALNLQIEEDWDKVSDRFPNADPAFRTVRAWRDLQADPGILRAHDFHDRAWRRRRSETREIEHFTRNR